MFGLQCFGFLWLAMCAYNTLNVVELNRRRKKIDKLEQDGHIYETMLRSISHSAMAGLFAALSILVLGMDLVGFALTYAYVPLNTYFFAAYVLIFATYIGYISSEILSLRKMGRIFKSHPRPFAVMVRYSRKKLNPSVCDCVAVYGRCLVSVQLFLNLIKL